MLCIIFLCTFAMLILRIRRRRGLMNFSLAFRVFKQQDKLIPFMHPYFFY